MEEVQELLRHVFFQHLTQRQRVGLQLGTVALGPLGLLLGGDAVGFEVHHHQTRRRFKGAVHHALQQQFLSRRLRIVEGGVGQQ